jgi:hypothetical protein
VRDSDDIWAWATVVDYSGLEPDLMLTAIEGRAADENRVKEIEYGLGGACLFPPPVVQEIDRAFRQVTDEQFGEHFSPSLMAEQAVQPEIWDEGDELLEDFLRPAFEQLRAFFSRAAEAKQNVVVVYT